MIIDFILKKHSILSHEFLMAYPYNLLNPTHPVTIGSHPYRNLYHNPIMYHIGLTCNIIDIPLYAAKKKLLYNLPIDLLNASHGQNPYLIVPPYTLEYQYPGPEILIA